MEQRSSSAVLQLEGVSIAARVGSAYLLQDISFAVFRGDRACILGPSGAGKTTLLRLLNRLSEPTAGSIIFNHRDFRQIPVRQLRQQIVLVPQEPKLLGMTPQEALAYPLVLQQLPKQEVQQRVEKTRERLRIPQEWLDRDELQLSLGQRQLVAITRALVMQPTILLLDEPTSALDAGRAFQLLEILTQMASSDEITILMVNHQLELAQQFGDHVLYLHDGQLIKDAVATEIDWAKLRQDFIEAQAKAAQEWS
jgi:D-methionine transport system ATP-binding protein